MSSALHIHLLGDFLLFSDETPITTVTIPRVQSLLGYLLLHRAAPQDRSHLAFLLWPDSTEAQAHTNLRKAFYQLRQAVPGVEQFVETGKHSIQWLAPPGVAWTLDVQDFEQALLRAEQAEHATDTFATRRALEQAVHLYRGDLLPHCYDEWILPERDRLRQLFLSAAEHLVALLEVERAYENAVAVAQQLLRQDPLHEATYRRLMRLHALRGERAAALRVYHNCVTVLERELATEPGAATRDLYESLLRAEVPVEAKTGPLAARGAAPPLLGRQAEWRQLQEVWRKAVAGKPQLLLLSGEAGIGKTRLAEEMKEWVVRQGIAAASARCYGAPGQLAYAPVTTWLRANALKSSLAALDPIWLTEVARLVPEVLTNRPDLPRPSPMTENWQRQHFFEALARAVLNTHHPLLLILDDLHGCDNETLEWLHYLLRFQPDARQLLLGTVRAEELSPEHPLTTLIGALQRDGLVTEIALGPLATAETTLLAEHIAGYQFETAMGDLLYRETEGNPLFVVEMVRAGTFGQDQEGPPGSGQRREFAVQTDTALPSTVQAVLSTRLAQLSTPARELANVAAVIGREFTFAILVHASGSQEDAAVGGLDDLWQRRIIREQGAEATETYDFSHDKLREQAYFSLSPAHRRLLHRRVAQAYEEVYADDLGGISGQIAAHYERAGLPERAISCYRSAAETALHIYANAEAIAALRRAAALLAARHGGSQGLKNHWEDAAQVYTALGDALVNTGHFQEARDVYQRGIASVPEQEHIWRACLLRKMADTWSHASHNPLDTSHANARQLFAEAEQVLAQAQDRSSIEWIREWIELQLAQLFPLRGSVEQMTAIIERAQPVIEVHGTADQRGQFFQAVIARDSKRNRYGASEQSLTYRRESLTALLRTGNKKLIGFAYFVLGNGLLFSHQLAEAEEQMRKAMSLAEQIGNTPLLVRCLTFLPLILRRRGQVEEVRMVLAHTQAVPEANDVSIIKGHRAWLAWRDGKLAEAEAYARAALAELEHPQGRNAFRWTGLWPLIGVLLAQEKFADALASVRMLLDPTQQPLPEEMSALLELALRVWDAGQAEEARVLLKQATSLAASMGYL